MLHTSGDEPHDTEVFVSAQVYSGGRTNYVIRIICLRPRTEPTATATANVNYIYARMSRVSLVKQKAI